MNQRILFNGEEKDLVVALDKRNQGKGMTNTEISLVKAFDRARQHGDMLVVKPFNSTPPHDDPRPKKTNISVEDVEGLQKAIRQTIQTSDTSSGGNTEALYPFDITLSGGSATFVYGTINNIAPTNINNSVVVSTSGTQYVYLACSAVNGVFTSSTITASSTAPGVISPNIGYPPNSFSVLIHVVVNGVSFRIINRSSIQAISTEAFRKQKLITTPDMLPYDSYYTWSISDV